MAFFENMEFSSEDIYEYEINDSIYKFPDRVDKVGVYLVASDYKDTIYYQIIERSNNNLILKFNNEVESFSLKNK